MVLGHYNMIVGLHMFWFLNMLPRARLVSTWRSSDRDVSCRRLLIATVSASIVATLMELVGLRAIRKPVATIVIAVVMAEKQSV